MIHRPPFNSSLASMKALIIGIDKYHDRRIHELGSAVFDAERMKRLCISHGMCEQKAVKLYNQDATRQAILHQISAFSMDQQIGIGDPILIYFAGHGAEVEITRLGEVVWSTSGQSFKEPVIMPTPGTGGISISRSTDLNDAPLPNKIQMLLPYDFIVDNGSQINGEGQGILDFVLGESLAELASKKGNNITVILDSCHSGSGCRGYDGQDPSVRVRGMTLNSLHKFELHDQLRRPPGALNDYVLLAACRPEGLAYENRDGGYFTTEIVKRLQDGINGISPSQLVQQMSVNGFRQQPQCEGVHSNRPLFSQMELSDSSLLTVVVEYRDDNGQFLQHPLIILQSGEESGSLKDAGFKVYADLHLKEELGHFVVLKPYGLGKSLLKLHPGYPKPKRDLDFLNGRKALNGKALIGYAVRWRSNHRLTLYHSSFPNWFRDWVQRFNDDHTSPVEIHLQKTPPDHPPVPGVYVSSFEQEHRISFEVTDYIGEERTVFGRFYASVKDSSKLSHIFCSMAKFYRHLNHQCNTVESNLLISYVKLECFKLRGVSGTLLSREPDGPNLVQSVTNGQHSQLIDVVVDPGLEPVYGFKIINTSDEPDASLSCALFFFDPRKLEIIEFYHPVIAAKTCRDHPRDGEPYIHPGHDLTIGYRTIGNGITGRRPASFTITDGEESDLGYLLLYVSLSALSLQHISMPSPLTFDGYSEIPNQSRGCMPAESPEYWAVQKILVVIRRKAVA
ncbi:hypothetical protein D9758_015144 [Tetrapyrgos nigripes]|uniref:Peptidase C14 caspase domain-containing protein n=1 Tax=Tetrapyrgos nigripes TaxID=182062 RepID=A0A8H5CPG3_9AGAR|nr:hypothetical protein D9758_015144 [Tetrapyrgos nigripes]